MNEELGFFEVEVGALHEASMSAPRRHFLRASIVMGAFSS